jgi:hypothetical protein
MTIAIGVNDPGPVTGNTRGGLTLRNLLSWKSPVACAVVARQPRTGLGASPHGYVRWAFARRWAFRSSSTAVCWASRPLHSPINGRQGQSGRTRSSWLRDSMPSLVKTLRRWYWTVRGLSCSSPVATLCLRPVSPVACSSQLCVLPYQPPQTLPTAPRSACPGPHPDPPGPDALTCGTSPHRPPTRAPPRQWCGPRCMGAGGETEGLSRYKPAGA